MFRKLIAGISLMSVGFAAAPAYALVDAQLLVGRRWYKFEGSQGSSSTGVQAQEVGLAAHIDPIPLVSIAFGGSFSMMDLNKNDLEGSVSEAKITEAALEVMAWVPMVPFVTPYARFKYPVVAAEVVKYTVGNQEIAATSKLSGYHLNAGVRYAPLPLISVLAEVGLGMQQAELDEYKIDGQKQSAAGGKTDANSQVFLVGVQVGL